ncbi:D-alanyl-D-alanine carboxypeptidase (penicillin-binding protein 5/6) [Lachnospiraceae bacterium XBB1006]|nr:D-alanyl-D-alanine carboxypeptidase (penicillin-binding protein 5/6) [Lachnospiraceae bacterium XBB1006]
MKCTNKQSVCVLMSVFLCITSLTGCKEKQALEKPYDSYAVTSEEKSISSDTANMDYLGATYCEVPETDILSKTVDTEYVKAGGVFNLTTKETPYAFHATEKVYPASTTKILTAYLVLKNAKLKDSVVISKEAVMLPAGASRAGLNEGDEVSVEGLLYGLMMVSGNDAAKALAEHVSGSVEAFSELMNQTAKELGATHSHFVNANGIHDENHYTTVYDLYLIMQKACEDSRFLRIIGTKKKTITIHRASGYEKAMTYESGNRFLTGSFKVPSSYKVLGGKSGTTYNAGRCFVLLAETKKKERYIFIVMGADNGTHMASYMKQMMKSVRKK